ncbi:GNAT family N-acetyltransferase [Nesterenkonia sp.]|uniref:GNAT family N-acetyltransferase n=1 Tax=Nesterenkonia sp. TaxID=704201 RepID=UPI0026116F43|nr:GNAT family N-acetyltransferase [Nesterenkonia sp.]
MTGSPARIRRAEPRDYQRIGDLTVAAYIDGGHMSAQDGYIAHLREVADRAAAAEVWVADVDGAVAGSVTVTDWDGPWAEVSRPGEIEFRMLAVAPEFQGRGIARQLVRHVIAQAEARPEIQAVTLCSLTSMRTAHQLYRAEGFTTDPDRDFVLITEAKTARFPFFIRAVHSGRPASELLNAEGE